MSTAAAACSERAQFLKDGFLVKRGCFKPEEVAQMQEECERLQLLKDYIDPNNLRTLPKKNVETEEMVLERFDPLVDLSPVFKALVEDRRIHATLELIFSDRALLFKDKLIFKFPGTEGYGLHQDWNQWLPFTSESISVMIAIDGADAHNGALELFPGYHCYFYEGEPPMRSEPVLYNRPEFEGRTAYKFNQALAQIVDKSTAVLVETQPGDAIFFHSLTPHRSGPNRSDRTRRQFYPTFSAARSGDQYQAHYRHVHRLRRDELEKNGRVLYFR